MLKISMCLVCLHKLKKLRIILTTVLFCIVNNCSVSALEGRNHGFSQLMSLFLINNKIVCDIRIVSELVKAFDSHAEVWMFGSKSLQIYVIKTGSYSSTADCSTTGVSVTDPRRRLLQKGVQFLQGMCLVLDDLILVY